MIPALTLFFFPSSFARPSIVLLLVPRDTRPSVAPPAGYGLPLALRSRRSTRFTRAPIGSVMFYRDMQWV